MSNVFLQPLYLLLPREIILHGLHAWYVPGDPARADTWS